MELKDLEIRMQKLNYPTNHMYDVRTMKPTGVLVERMKLLHENASEMFEKSKSFLDIGCNKGFISFEVAKTCKEVTGYEPAAEIFGFAEDIRQHYKIENVKFFNNWFYEIPEDKRYDVVYVGNIHHYLFNDDHTNGKKPFTFIKKLKKITNKILILDGNYEVTDFAINALANENNWNEKTRKAYTIKGFEKALLPGCKSVRMGFNGIGKENSQRFTTVFKCAN